MRSLVLAGLGGLGILLAGPAAALCDAGGDPAAAWAAAAPSVVAVEGAAAEGRRFGSGVVWDGAGHVVTSRHVAEGLAAPLLRLADGRAVPAAVVGLAPGLDLAVLRPAAPLGAPALPRGRSAGLRVGAPAFAIGNPFGIGLSLSRGVVSGLHRGVALPGGARLDAAIQTDASLNPGHSGGALLDGGGCLVGIATAILSPSGGAAGVGFALPVEAAERAVAALLPPAPAPPRLGIAAEDSGGGVLVLAVDPGSRAERAGGRPGDLILDAALLGGARRAPGPGVAALAGLLAGAAPGDRLRLTVRRGGRLHTLDVPLGDVPLGDAPPRAG
ncbi:MAG TPA: trypsin-like peptidase domain-containing protein [Alphaproteobacteria bacterium]|nr:trypsin-like peptidase domain-containing protein [Alphaproteobacteria bacterium]